MNEVNNFSEQLKVFDVSASSDERFKFDAIYNFKNNRVLYNPCLLTQKRAEEIVVYVANIRK